MGNETEKNPLQYIFPSGKVPANSSGSPSTTNALAKLKGMSPKTRKWVAEQLSIAGYGAPKNAVIGPKFVEALAKFSYDYQAWVRASGQTVDELEFLALRAKEEQKDSAASKRSTGPSTSVNIQESNYDAARLKQVVNTAFQNAIGREATDAEITAAVNAVNAAYDKNPSKQVSTSTTDKAGKVTTKTVSSGGIDAGQVITDQAQSNPEFAPYQMATTYFDAMLEALRGPVGQGA